MTLLPRGMVPPVPPLPYMEWGEVPADHPGRSDLAAFGTRIRGALAGLSWWTRVRLRWDPWTQAWLSVLRDDGVDV